MTEQEKEQTVEQAPVIRQEIHYSLAGKAVIELRPINPEKDGPSVFLLKGGLELNGKKGEFTKQIEGALTVEAAYQLWDAAFAAGVVEVKQKITEVSGRIVLPGQGGPGGNGQFPHGPYKPFGGGPKGRGVRGL